MIFHIQERDLSWRLIKKETFYVYGMGKGEEYPDNYKNTLQNTFV